MKSHTLFISDLHLQSTYPKITDHFYHFLKHQALQADAVYILGDLFETWVGDDDNTNFNHQVMEALRIAATKVPIYFIRGNRDFLIGTKFEKATELTCLEDPTVILLYNRPVLLMHGDSLCTLDRKHQIYRRAVAKPWVQKLMLSVPLSLRRRFARKFREKSSQHYQRLSPEMKDIDPNEVVRVIQRNDVKLLIHGHTHIPKVHSLMINGKTAYRIVLGAWHEEYGSILSYFNDGQFELLSFNKESISLYNARPGQCLEV